MNINVLFDMDGVLVDSEPVINIAAIKGLSEFGVNAKPEDFIPFIGAGEDRYVGGVAEKYGINYKVEMKNRVYQIYLDIVNEQIKTYDGVLELLKSLKKSEVKFALASSADLVKVIANLKAAGIAQSLFNAIISGEDAKNKKPAPDIYLYAAQKINAKSEDCIVVEDALNGIQAAKAAGMKCIALTTSFSYEEIKNEKPDFICANLFEVRTVLEGFLKVN